MKRNRALVICIGNALAGDDGAGAAVYHYFQESNVLADEVRLVFLGLGGIDLLEEMDGEEVMIVIDAVQLGAPPGTIHQLSWENMPENGERPVSGHGIGVREAIAVASRLYPGRVPRRCWLIGIEGRIFDQLGERLSPEVASSIPHAAATVAGLVAGQ